VLAVLGVVVVGGGDAAVAQLLGELAVPVDVGEALATAVGLGHGLDFDAKVVVPDHDGGDGCDAMRCDVGGCRGGLHRGRLLVSEPSVSVNMLCRVLCGFCLVYQRFFFPLLNELT
jgi:hypothetical protein